MTHTAQASATYDAMSATSDETAAPALRALRFGGWANIAIGVTQTVGLIWAWSMFRFVGIEEDMREIATQGAALPYVFTLITAAGFLVFGLYALSGAGDLRRLPLLRTGLVAIAIVYLTRATVYEGISAVSDGDVTQIAFAAIALIIGLCYAYGAIATHRVNADAPTPIGARSQPARTGA